MGLHRRVTLSKRRKTQQKKFIAGEGGERTGKEEKTKIKECIEKMGMYWKLRENWKNK